MTMAQKHRHMWLDSKEHNITEERSCVDGITVIELLPVHMDFCFLGLARQILVYYLQIGHETSVQVQLYVLSFDKPAAEKASLNNQNQLASTEYTHAK
jgi:hypothetical protein